MADTVHIVSDDPDDPEMIVSLTGMGVADAADIAVLDDVTDLDFPDTRVGYPRTEAVSVTNMGNQTLNIDEILIEGSDAFSVDQEDGTLTFMDTLTVTVTFDPQSDGDFSANLLFTSDDPDEGTVTIPLTGSAATNITLYVPTEFTTIQSAIDTAYSGDTIQVAAGTYTENIVFSEENIVLRGEGADSTILNGNNVGAVITLTADQTSATQISHLTVTGGNAATGGGIAAYTATPVIRHVIVHGNTATTSGGGIYLEGNATLSHVTVFGNTSGGNGDGINHAGTGTIAITNSILWGNGTEDLSSTGTADLTYSIIGDDAWLSGAGNKNESPDFVDEANGDFNLNWGSPAMDAGDPNSPDDPDGSRADMGALPYTGGLPEIASVNSVDFGDVLMGDAESAPFTIYNLGTVALRVDSLTIDN